MVEKTRKQGWKFSSHWFNEWKGKINDTSLVKKIEFPTFTFVV